MVLLRNKTKDSAPLPTDERKNIVLNRAIESWDSQLELLAQLIVGFLALKDIDKKDFDTLRSVLLKSYKLLAQCLASAGDGNRQEIAKYQYNLINKVNTLINNYKGSHEETENLDELRREIEQSRKMFNLLNSKQKRVFG